MFFLVFFGNPNWLSVHTQKKDLKVPKKLQLYIQDDDFHKSLLYCLHVGFGVSLLVDKVIKVAIAASIFMTCKLKQIRETNHSTQARAVGVGGRVANLGDAGKPDKQTLTVKSLFMTEISGRREGGDSTAENIRWSEGDTACLS